MACVLPEFILLGADHGLWGTIRWRPDSYAYGAFWVGLLRGWLPNYPYQPDVMFVSYAFLHAGVWHLLVNIIVLVVIGRRIIRHAGVWRFVVLYFTCVIGGAIGFALLTSKLQPMIGASGALFGLIAAKLLWDAIDASNRKKSRFSTILRPAVIMVALNLGSYLLASGHLAWETHLGGTITGLLLAPMLRR